MKEPRAALHLTEEDHGRTIQAGVGQEVEVRLPENPTAGFRWHLAPVESMVCSLVDDAFEAGGAKPGQPGVHRWRFKIIGDGDGKIEMAYRRSWESGTSPARSFSISVNGKK